MKGVLSRNNQEKSSKPFHLIDQSKHLKWSIQMCVGQLTTILSGNKYFVSFVDEFTRKIWIYLVKEKSEVFNVFVKYFS